MPACGSHRSERIPFEHPAPRTKAPVKSAHLYRDAAVEDVPHRAQGERNEDGPTPKASHQSVNLGYSRRYTGEFVGDFYGPSLTTAGPEETARWWRIAGAANGANPIAIVLPCHRVIGADGGLVGYGGGLDRKAMLLAHERGEGVFGGLG